MINKFLITYNLENILKKHTLKNNFYVKKIFKLFYEDFF